MDLVGMEFLMEMMEWREAIEDAGTDQAELARISEQTTVLHQSCIATLEDLLDDVGDRIDDGVEKATLRDARRLAAELQYWHRLERTLKDATEVG